VILAFSPCPRSALAGNHVLSQESQQGALRFHSYGPEQETRRNSGCTRMGYSQSTTSEYLFALRLLIRPHHRAVVTTRSLFILLSQRRFSCLTRDAETLATEAACPLWGRIHPVTMRTNRTQEHHLWKHSGPWRRFFGLWRNTRVNIPRVPSSRSAD
jgi:hypothetical protein